jgi:hypothetical protein
VRFAKLPLDHVAKLMNSEPRRVDGDIRQRANGRQALALGGNRSANAGKAHRMRTPSLREAPLQGLVVGFEKQKPGRDLGREGAVDRRKAVERRTLAGVDDERRSMRLDGALGQISELRDEIDRQVIDRVIAKVLEGAQHGAFARPAEAGNDDDLRRPVLDPSRRRHQGSMRSNLPSPTRTSTWTAPVSASR